MAASDSNYAPIANVANYQANDSDIHGRLTNFTPSDAAEDTKRLCFLRIEGDDVQGLMDDLVNLEAYDQNVLPGILAQMNGTGSPEGSNGYAKFSITAVSDSREEKMQIMETNGDSFIATFTGRKPHIVGFSGNLIFDYAQEATWYHAFINAYEYFLRASRMAKHRCKLRMVMPDCQELVGYMINLNTNHESSTDSIIPISFSMLVVDKTPSRPNTFITDTTGGTDGTAKAVDTIDGEQDITDQKELDDLATHIPTSEEYNTYNELKDKIQYGDDLSEEELAQYTALQTKVNEQGQYRTQYNTVKLKYYQRLSNTGKITDDQANDLMELQEREYYALIKKQGESRVDPEHPYGGLTKEENDNYKQLSTVASADAMKRALLEKQSAGKALSLGEQKKLDELQDVDIYTADSITAYSNVPGNSISTDLGTGYEVVTQPNTPAANAVITANNMGKPSSFYVNNAKPNPKLASEVVKAGAANTINNYEAGQANSATPRAVQYVNNPDATYSSGVAVTALSRRNPAPVLVPTQQEVTDAANGSYAASFDIAVKDARVNAQGYILKMEWLLDKCNNCFHAPIYTTDHTERLLPNYFVMLRGIRLIFNGYMDQLKELFTDNIYNTGDTTVIQAVLYGSLLSSIDSYYTKAQSGTDSWSTPSKNYVRVQYHLDTMIEYEGDEYRG